MKSFVHFIGSVALFATAISLSSCETTRPDLLLLDGAVISASANDYKIVLRNPPSEFSVGDKPEDNYSIPRFLYHGQMQSYYLHQKAQQDVPYKFDIHTLEGVLVTTLEVRPNAIANDSPYDGQYPGLDWWYEFPTGRRMYVLEPTGGDQ
jgi:hypothetical protein